MRPIYCFKRMNSLHAALGSLTVLVGVSMSDTTYASFHAIDGLDPTISESLFTARMMPANEIATMDMDEAVNGSAMSSDSNMGNMMRPAMIPPPGISGASIPPEGKLMLSFSSTYMKMQGNRSGTSSVSQDQVLNDFMVAPLRMDVGMVMGMAMYGITDEWAVTGGASYIRKSMDHVNRGGTKFTTRSEGIGDPKIGTAYKLYQSSSNSLLAGLALNIPLGSIEEKDNTPADLTANNPLPYPMQLGSGTWDFTPSMSYMGTIQDYTWGMQAVATLRPGRNNNGYRLGNTSEISFWGSRDLADWVAVFGRVQGKVVGNIDGRDSQISTTMAPTGDPNRRGQRVVNLSVGLNSSISSGPLGGGKVAIEATVPVYQNLDGPQLETDFAVTAKVSLVF
jgi:hypothetical protein